MLRKRVGRSGKHQGRRQRHDAGGSLEETEPSSHLFAVIGGDICPCATFSTYQLDMQAHAMYYSKLKRLQLSLSTSHAISYENQRLIHSE